MSAHSTPSIDSLLDLVYKEGLSAEKWREIGTRLELKPSTLDEIEWAHPRSPTECLLKMLNEWLRYDEKATLEKYKNALRWACIYKSTMLKFDRRLYILSHAVQVKVNIASTPQLRFWLPLLLELALPITIINWIQSSSSQAFHRLFSGTQKT